MVRSGKRSAPFEVVLAELERQAPLALAESWDNVGLLIAPTCREPILSLGLTIDLTDAVLAEFVDREVEFVIAYHPPIFEPLKRLGGGDAKSQIAVAAIEAGIAVYSPHTALDSAPGGVNDWLIDGFGPGLKRALQFPRARISLESSQEEQPRVGQGRGLVLDDPQPLGVLVGMLKRRLGLQRLRIARHPRHAGGDPIRTIAVCAGAGGSVIADSGADLLVTGEMGHHHVLGALARGASVILSEHSHTERGFLPMFGQRLAGRLGIEVVLAQSDRDPLAWE